MAFNHSMNGDQLIKSGQIVKALEEYKEAARLDPYNWRRHYQLAEAYEKQNHLNDAIREYRKVLVLSLQVNPPFHNQADYAFPHFWLGRTLYKNRQIKEAMVELKTAVKIGATDKKQNKHLSEVVQQSRQLLKGLRQ